VVLLVVFMALFMFWGGEQLERLIGKKDLKKEPKLRYAGAGALVLVAVAVLVMGQPTTTDKWTYIAPEKELKLNAREVQIQPAELLSTMHDHKVNLVMLDMRAEADYNLFHIKGAQNVTISELPELSKQMQVNQPLSTVVVVMGNSETVATEAWKTLSAESAPNPYILEGGVNNWLATFGEEDSRIEPTPAAGDENLRFTFPAALGASYPAAAPSPEEYELEFTPKIQLQNKKGAGGGGCG
jgi:rhodanese-related sulfurtransferase